LRDNSAENGHLIGLLHRSGPAPRESPERVGDPDPTAIVATMRPRPQPVSLAAALLCAVATTAPLRSQAVERPAFVDGDLGRIACKVTAATVQFGEVTRLEVEVHNRGTVAFEPTVFEVRTAKDAPAVRFERAPLPRLWRTGRTVPPRKKQRFALQIAGAFDRPRALDVAVVEGNFTRDGSPIDTPPIVIVRSEHGTTSTASGTVPTTTVHLRNDLDATVDAILSIRTTAPVDGDVLVPISLGPREEAARVLTQTPVDFAWVDPRSYREGIRGDAIRVVDWSARVAPNAAAGPALLEPAYRAWLRWDPTEPWGLRGRFAVVRRTTIQGVPPLEEWGGEFSIDPAGRVRATAATERARGEGIQHIQAALRDLLRPPWDEVAAANELELVAPATIQLRGPGWGDPMVASLTESASGAHRGAGVGPRRHPVVVVDGGRLAGSGWSDQPDAATWRTAALADGYVVTEVSWNWGRSIRRWTYRQVGPRCVPVRVVDQSLDATDEIVQESVLVLEDVTLDPAAIAGDAPRPVPTGAIADALRAAWDSFYRYPREPVALTARFAVENPATDDVWLGQRKVEGELSVQGFAGYRWLRSSWDAIDVRVDGTHRPEAIAALGFAVRDRIGMWKGRDPAALEDFDRMFAGTQLARREAGSAQVFEVRGGPVTEVWVEDGVITRLGFGNGVQRRFTWATVAGRRVAAKIQTGEETLTARWKAVDDRWLLPVDVEFRTVFASPPGAPRWGPERLRWSGIELR